MDWLDGGEDLLTAQREFDPIFRPFKRNVQFLGLIRLEFNSGKTKIIARPPIIASSRFPNKPKLLDQRVKASLTRQE
jgi:hypothetical protein